MFACCSSRAAQERARCASNFNFFKSGPSWVLIPSKRRRATAESAAHGLSELQRARVGLGVPCCCRLWCQWVAAGTPASPGTVPVTTSASDLGCKHRDMPVVQQTPSPTSESSQAGCLCSGSSYRIAMIHARNQMRVPEQHHRAPNRATSGSRHRPCADCACTCLRYAVDTFHLCLLWNLVSCYVPFCFIMITDILLCTIMTHYRPLVQIEVSSPGWSLSFVPGGL